MHSDKPQRTEKQEEGQNSNENRKNRNYGQPKELRKENNRLHNFIHNIFQVMKKFFRKILKFGNENDKDDVVKEVKGAYEMDVYDKIGRAHV